MTDTTELYYAEMESARNDAEEAYFKARPQLQGSIGERSLFRAGFERAYQKLYWSMRPMPALPSVPLPVWPAVGQGQVTIDCGCPINQACMNVACSRRSVTVTCSAVGKKE